MLYLKSLINKKYWPAVFAITIFLLALLFDRQLSEPDYSSAVLEFQTVLHKKEKKLNTLMGDIAQQSINNSLYFSQLYDNEGIIILIYDNDTLQFWSDNAAPVEHTLLESHIEDGLIHLKNGWYEASTKSYAGKTIIGLILIKNDYPYQNQYLTNSFQSRFLEIGLPDGCKLVKTKTEWDASFPITSANGNYLCSLTFENSQSSGEFAASFAILFYVISFIFLILFLKAISFGLIKNIAGASLLLICIILALRYLTIRYEFPQSIYMLPLFSPNNYATSFLFPSLGDFLINSIVIFYLTYFIHKNIQIHKTTAVSPAFSIIYICLGLLIIFILSLPIYELFEGLIINSKISFNVNNLFELSLNSLIGFISIGLLLFSFFFIADKIVSFVLSTLSLPPVRWTFFRIILLLVVFSLISANILSKYNNIKERDHRKLLAEKLAVEQDPIASYMFQDIENKIINDSILLNLLTIPERKDSLINYITEKYFKGFWEKYDAQITICKPNDSLLIQPDNIVKECRLLFTGMITEQGEPTASSRFYFLNTNNGRISYLAKLLFPKADIFIELDSKFIHEELGYPELLLDARTSRNIRSDIKNYSYAKYNDGRLVNQTGEFHYSITNKNYVNTNSEFSFTDIEGYNHLIHNIDEHTSVVLSKKDETLLDTIIRFSYLFAFFCLSTLIFITLRKLPVNFSELRLDFKRRIELSMILILLVSLLPIGIGTKYFIENQYKNKNHDNIHEKLHSVLIEVEHKLAGTNDLTENMRDFLSFILIKFSYVFFTDVNLYDPQGNLLASSRPEIFDKGLIGKKINAEAFYQLAKNEKTEFIHDECIGKLNYLSAYAPFRNEDNKLLAYINLPYFAKQNELEEEISTFLVALINIYVLLIILAIIVALFLSNRITQPLSLIREKIGKIKLGSANEPIEWKSRDEIGSLVGEYNRMIAELEKSAGLLARSERESAWREMAKQVAHEIKNPLTPMKLSVQHLEKAWNDKAPDWEKRLQQFTQTLTQQIDALSSIAGGFSDFARMPSAKKEPVDLTKVIVNAIDLYKDTKGVEINFMPENNDYQVLADKEQLLQVLNNLLKNAIQAIPESKEVLIGIELNQTENDYTIKITDNGIGIPEEQKDKIFVPNFTTKTGGMGLGLAIVKSIVENSGGMVWFESEEDAGATFYVSLPKMSL